MSSRKLTYFYLPILAILLTLIAIGIDCYYGNPIRDVLFVFIPLMALLLGIGIKNKVWKE